jgi:alkanesulfonate monooxygenase SsuD/methylene tetrahydromethanopterin reductase-like flavin-dependent oxidoreductase (luciferase family)
MNIPMTEPRNPLEVVEEALAACADELAAELAYRYRQTKDHPAMRTRFDRDMEVVNDARAALALVRKMRADAVVGSHDALVEALREIAEHEHPGNTLSGYHDLRAIASAALASLTDEESAP